jgi:hypothetical protein
VGQRDSKETEGAKQTEYKPVENQKKIYPTSKNKLKQSNEREKKLSERLMK